MNQAPGGDGVAHENRGGDDVPESHATAPSDETAPGATPEVTPEAGGPEVAPEAGGPEVAPEAGVPEVAPDRAVAVAVGAAPEVVPAVGAAPENPDALDERDELSGQRMVKIEPGPGEGDDELALRRLFQDAVGDLEPSLGSLEHLRRAVPARRARKRQAVVGAAAAAVLIGTAVPAFVHVAASGGLSAANPVNAGHGEQAQGGTGAETGVEGGQSSKAPASTVSPSPGAADGSSGKPQSPGAGASGEGPQATLGGDPDATPRCVPGQLGVGAAQAGGPEGDGKVYGTFRIANVSAQDCLLDGAGIVGFEARGAADPGKITVTRHTSGDGGSALPDPSKESSALVLKPSGSYEVKFVWVPSETCPTTGTTPTPTPTTPPEPTATPTPTATASGGTGNPDPSTGPDSGGTGTGPGTGAEEGSGAGAAPQLLRADGTPADGSVVVSHTAEPGGPVASAVIPNACAGTIYRTGVLATTP
ncbi:hypothetical protein ACFTUC_19475 [Streptomyces sp. NPDC056944]|uniref:hypothetical protein n=1 Tax=Streptomyces sp. NPDC056944 TaxID=3345972 RepID=UPI00362A1402